MKYSFILPRVSVAVLSACVLWEPTSAFSLNTITKSTTYLYAASSSDDDGFVTPNMDDVGFVVLAGGTGSRMKANMRKLAMLCCCCCCCCLSVENYCDERQTYPILLFHPPSQYTAKQYLPLKGVPVLHYSLDLFLDRLVDHCTSRGTSPPTNVVLVMDPKYQPEYQPIVDRYSDRLQFANPGVERQGSVENGLNKLVEMSNGKCQYAAIHDSARPLVTIEEVCNVVSDAKEHGAAVLGVPCKATIKESEDGSFVLRTIPRARLFEVHTPQVVKIETLLRGFQKVAEENLEVTDDVSIVEALGEPVKITRGEYTNLKITTPEDMDVATAILEDRKSQPVNMLV